MKSHFLTEDPDEADFFYMPFSIALIRDDHRLDIAGISVFVKSYILNITNNYPYWNRTGGADHFYFACHSKGRFAFDKAFVAKLNVIQLLCSSNLYISSYVAHKDAPVPQVWPRLDAPPIPNLLTRERKQLGFFSGGMNSRTRVYLLKVWDNDTEIFTHHGRLPTPYSEQLLGSKFCIHARGYEVNSARIADALYYGCVPVILSNHYDLPFTDILNWKSFSVIVHERDIPILKRILQGISSEEYAMLQSNVVKIRKHFQWHTPPTDFDALHMSLYELWQRRSVVKDIKSFTNQNVRLLQHDKSIVEEDDLDRRWEEATGEVVDEVIFFSKHTAVSNRPALTVHPIGVPHLREGDVPPQGGRPGWAAPPDPRIGPWLRLLKKIAQSRNLVPEFEITLEGTHHGPVTSKPTLFLEIGSTDEYWKRQDAAQVIALVEYIFSLVWEGLGLGGGDAVGNWGRENDKNKVLLGIGGGHYAPRHMDIVVKDGVWVGHLLSGYSLPMEDPGQSKGNGKIDGIGGTWRESIKVAYEATKSAFPGGEVLAHLDQKSFKSWQKNAIIAFLGEQNIKIGKPNDFV
ncbi:Exostosin-like protein [Corchorus capsularis]|uniref:Exostosin-like protein n=1 Tax=Corchorus capsularis TaxID=210143 RepID=A0A1R3JFK9_COCAP|nr:Exostosin-like protein [Corchorus capsularis]